MSAPLDRAALRVRVGDLNRELGEIARQLTEDDDFVYPDGETRHGWLAKRAEAVTIERERTLALLTTAEQMD